VSGAILCRFWLHRQIWALRFNCRVARGGGAQWTPYVRRPLPLCRDHVMAVAPRHFFTSARFFFVQDYSNEARFYVRGLPLAGVLLGYSDRLSCRMAAGTLHGSLYQRWTIREPNCLIASGRREFEFLGTGSGSAVADPGILTPIDYGALPTHESPPVQSCVPLGGLDPTRRLLTMRRPAWMMVKRRECPARAFAALAAQSTTPIRSGH